MGVVRSLRSNIARYNSKDISKDTGAESEWIQIYGDVFRLPFGPEYLTFYAFNGIHLLSMFLITICKKV